MYLILMFQWMEHGWLIFRFFSIDFDEVEAFGKDEFGSKSFFGHQSMGHTFLLLGESDAGALRWDFGGDILLMVRNVLEEHWGTFPHDCIEIGWIKWKFE